MPSYLSGTGEHRNSATVQDSSQITNHLKGLFNLCIVNEICHNMADVRVVSQPS
jgi:hypothetical protein